jgi:hypothetical protein
VGDQDQGEVVVPAAEAATLEVVQPKRTLQVPVILVDRQRSLPSRTSSTIGVASGRLASQYLTGSGCRWAIRPAANGSPAPTQPRRPGRRPDGQGDPDRADPQGHKAGALPALAGPPPDQLHAGGLAGGQGELGERAGRSRERGRGPRPLAVEGAVVGRTCSGEAEVSALTCTT